MQNVLKSSHHQLHWALLLPHLLYQLLLTIWTNRLIKFFPRLTVAHQNCLWICLHYLLWLTKRRNKEQFNEETGSYNSHGDPPNWCCCQSCQEAWGWSSHYSWFSHHHWTCILLLIKLEIFECRQWIQNINVVSCNLFPKKSIWLRCFKVEFSLPTF